MGGWKSGKVENAVKGTKVGKVRSININRCGSSTGPSRFSMRYSMQGKIGEKAAWPPSLQGRGDDDSSGDCACLGDPPVQQILREAKRSHFRHG